MNRDIVQTWAERTELRGLLPDCDGSGRCEEPDCGDLLEIGFRTLREIITEIGYTITDTACPPMKACAAAAAALAKDKAVLEAYLITHQQIAEQVGGLDREAIHCAMMAELALKRAIIDYSRRKKQQQAG